MNITEKALKQLEKLNTEDKLLRFSIQGGGCSGMQYYMDFTNQANQQDKYITLENLTVIIDPKSYLFLQDVIVDFEDDLNGQGFTYTNPRAKRTCGCGSSFGV